MLYYRTTGLILTQMQELVRRVNDVLDEPWDMPTGRPKSLRLYKAVEAACMYLRQNATQEFIGNIRDTSQPTISRYLAALVPLVKSVLEEFVPSAADAIEVVTGPGCPGRWHADTLLVLRGAPGTVEQEAQDHGLQRAIDMSSRRVRRLDIRPLARKDSRREGIQGDRGRWYRKGIRWRIRR